METFETLMGALFPVLLLLRVDSLNLRSSWKKLGGESE